MSLKRFIVPDLTINIMQLEVVLILESPHTKEILHGHPLAGQAGQRMTHIFKRHRLLNTFNHTSPLGCQVKKLKYPELSIINACIIPMHKNAYTAYCMSSVDARLSKKLNKVKEKLQRRIIHNYKPVGVVEKFIVSNFHNRINNIINAHNGKVICFIPCGNFATNIFNTCNISGHTVINGCPHPSSRNWQNFLTKNSIANCILP
ncbi:hypothetical protein IU367_06885 [Aeromonas bestiarum]|uniref:uracil-DNA glycosylase family protein n=1 Tax=Aeromonas bestiarum TaxID=105751 RepID=UPI00237890E6|nr:uracil-DNA glycosylase family protein [Aeromonas bestiarum]WDL83906.1 hypothetical protein IU367_06885 [Aeromonas bestiarum]